MQQKEKYNFWAVFSFWFQTCGFKYNYQLFQNVALECEVPLTLVSPNFWSAGTVPQLRRRLPAAAVATSGAAGGRPARELATLRVRDHCRPAEGQQTLELQQGITEKL